MNKETINYNLIQGVGVPKQLQNYGFNFCKIPRGEKRCFERGWNTKVYRFDDSSLRAHIQAGGNYGVQANNSIVEGKQLCIIDFDDRAFMDKIIGKFPETFTTTSGSPKGCFHLWLLTDKHLPKLSIKDSLGATLCDYFGSGGQVIGPGSLHTKGSTYSIVKDVPLAILPNAEIIKILEEASPEKKIEIRENKSSYKVPVEGFYGKCIDKLSIADILGEVNIDTQKNPTSCPFHSSVRGECFSFGRNVWNCWHCDTSGNLFQIVQKIWSLNTKETYDKLAELAGLEDELLEFRREFMEEQDGL